MKRSTVLVLLMVAVIVLVIAGLYILQSPSTGIAATSTHVGTSTNPATPCDITQPGCASNFG